MCQNPLHSVEWYRGWRAGFAARQKQVDELRSELVITRHERDDLKDAYDALVKRLDEAVGDAAAS